MPYCSHNTKSELIEGCTPGSGDGIRTHTISYKSADFKSAVAAITPHRHINLKPATSFSEIWSSDILNRAISVQSTTDTISRSLFIFSELTCY